MISVRSFHISQIVSVSLHLLTLHTLQLEGLLIPCLLLALVTSLWPLRLLGKVARLVSIRAVLTCQGGSGLVQEAWAASLWLVTSNDVLISAAYKVNPISGCHTQTRNNRGGRLELMMRIPNVIHRTVTQAGHSGLRMVTEAQWLWEDNYT